MTLALTQPNLVASVGAHERFVRNALFIVCFLLVTLTASPFPDLGDPGCSSRSVQEALSGRFRLFC